MREVGGINLQIDRGGASSIFVGEHVSRVARRGAQSAKRQRLIIDGVSTCGYWMDP